MITVYISIGNSDDKLTQSEWSLFVDEFASKVNTAAGTVHGFWLSESSDPWQNACSCIEIDLERANGLWDELAALAGKYRQDSIAWAVAETDFITPKSA